MAVRRETGDGRPNAWMWLWLCAVVFSAAATPPAAEARKPKRDDTSDKTTPAMVLLGRCAALYALQSSGAKPFRLEADYHQRDAEGNAADGHMTLYWKAPDAWRSEVTVGKSRRVEFRKGDEGALLEPTPLTLEEEDVAAGLAEKLDVRSQLALPENASVELKRGEPQEGAEVSEVIVRDPSGLGSKILRVDNGSGTLIGVGDPWAFTTRYQTDIREGIGVPVRVEETQAGEQISLWSLTALSEWQPDEGLLAIPEGAVVFPVCRSAADRLKLERRVDPRYPSAAKAMGQSGQVTLSIRVSADGKVLATHRLRSTNAMFDEAALEAVKQWKYRLAPCMATQAPVRWLVVVNFEAAR